MGKKKDKNDKANKPDANRIKEGEQVEQPVEDLSIEKFLKIRKLQNQVLEKMLDKLNKPNAKNQKKS